MPVLSVIAGPNGSGKSTLTTMLTRHGVEFGEYLNADDIAVGLTGSAEWVSRQAQQIVRDRRADALNKRRDHCFETVMSHPSHIDYMIEARHKGLEVRLYFVATEDPVINIDRVANRVAHGGHRVPEQRIVDRYHRCLAQLPLAIRAADYSMVYDNSRPGEPLRHLATIMRNQDEGFSLAKHWGDRRGLDIPVWWLECLAVMKPENPLDQGWFA